MSVSARKLVSCIDTAHSANSSIVLRYRDAFRLEASDEQDELLKTLLTLTSIQEGTRIFPLLNYKGVDVQILDDTSLMHTKTLKSIDGCVTIARCKLHGDDRVVFESGGNTGMALTAYGQNVGLDTFCFLPEENVYLLNSERFSSEHAYLISVAEPGKVKEAAHTFAQRNRLPRIPQTGWRYEASRFRGMFLAETIAEQGGFDWFSQTISAAFGPIGIYSVLHNFSAEIGPAPRFLGVQQHANCPMYRRWKLHDQASAAEIHSTDQMLTRVMYDVRPQTYGTYEDLESLLNDTFGDLTTVNHKEFAETLEADFDGGTILDWFRRQGLDITTNANGVVEKTGLIALVGTLKEIDRGTIAPGSKVLCGLTSGVSEADGRAAPDLHIGVDEDLDRALARFSDSILPRAVA